MITSSIDLPIPNALLVAEQIRIGGWLYCHDRHSELRSVSASWEGKRLEQTAFFFERPDVTAALSISAGSRTGFSLLAGIFDRPKSLTSAVIELRAHFSVGQDELLSRVPVRFADIQMPTRHYGSICSPAATEMMHRDNIYSSGPSSPVAAPEAVALIQRYLPTTGNILDIGCGIGAYGIALRERGYNWFGVEVKESDCMELARLDLPHRLVDGSGLPFRDGEFANSICIEVLEHIPDYRSFLSEIKRVVRGRKIFSVPNIELLPLYHPLHVVPWHLLEGDHKNFFTRFNLHHLLSQYFERVEIIDYGKLPVRTGEGFEVYNHLFAIAE